jgi:hypothetical protein
MKWLFVVLFLAACNSDMYLEARCSEAYNKGVAAGSLLRDQSCYREKCNSQCAPSPGVADVSDVEQKHWRCGCLPAEKKP